MPNPWGRMGAPMVQPTKDELRGMIRNLRDERDNERERRELLEQELKTTKSKLDEAARLLGHQVIDASSRADVITRLRV